MYRTLIVTDEVNQLNLQDDNIISFAQYLSDFPQRNEPKTRVINLCDTERYLSQGYYCSLLAEARNHRVLPSVNTINDLRLATESDELTVRFALPENVENTAALIAGGVYKVFFGEVDNASLASIGHNAFARFACPILELSVVQHDGNTAVICKAVGLNALGEEDKQLFATRLRDFTQQQWVNKRTVKKVRWDMAMLVNPTESTPPSDAKAITNFVKAGEKAGFHVDVVTSLSPRDVGQYDALFIRETTAIDHHTYRLARAAEREGLVVIDDTQSILRCCNKVFLQDAFSYHQVPAPRTEFVSRSDVGTCQALAENLGLPLVLKLPESSFSRGVYKVDSVEKLGLRLEEMLKESALVLVQEYVFTEFDWRIGVLGGKPIYACKYFMARNHWQIYHHEGDKFSSGDFVTMATFEVPKPVLNAAVKAAKAVGNGLYGVDIKQRGNAVYVIEVNDNPSIDAGVEDKYLGKELYSIVMQEFANRLEQRGR